MSNYLEQLYYKLPKNFRMADLDQRQQLKRFLNVAVEGGLKPLREETENLLTLFDFDRVPAKYLPHLASALGFTFPYDLDDQTQRTYIKNAVASYKIKGTITALEFMIRELTHFMVEVDVEEATKTLNVLLTVDAERQDIDKAREKIEFIVDEYSPPYKKLNIINIFLWVEIYERLITDSLENNVIKLGDSLKDFGFMTNRSRIGSSTRIVQNIERYEIVRQEEYLS